MAEIPFFSFDNILLVLYQKPSATHLHNSQYWETIGRKRKAVEKPIRILLSVKEDEVQYVPVFDLSQTEGKAFSDKRAFIKTLIKDELGLLVHAYRNLLKINGEDYNTLETIIKYHLGLLSQKKAGFKTKYMERLVNVVTYIVGQRYNLQLNQSGNLTLHDIEDKDIEDILIQTHEWSKTVINFIEGLQFYNYTAFYRSQKETKEAVSFLKNEFQIDINESSSASQYVFQLMSNSHKIFRATLQIVNGKFILLSPNGLAIHLSEIARYGHYKIINVFHRNEYKPLFLNLEKRLIIEKDKNKVFVKYCGDEDEKIPFSDQAIAKKHVYTLSLKQLVHTLSIISEEELSHYELVQKKIEKEIKERFNIDLSVQDIKDISLNQLSSLDKKYEAKLIEEKGGEKVYQIVNLLGKQVDEPLFNMLPDNKMVVNAKIRVKKEVIPVVIWGVEAYNYCETTKKGDLIRMTGKLKVSTDDDPLDLSKYIQLEVESYEVVN